MSILINNKYEILEKIGEGSFGKVFKGMSIRTHEIVAIKIQHKDILKVLRYEAKIYNHLKNISGIPNMRTFGVLDNYNFLVLDYVGISLLELNLKPEKIIQCTPHLIEILKNIHNNNIIHRDIKPENLLYLENKNKFYIIDFGLAKSCTLKDKNYTEERKSENLIGTAKYSSLNIHNNIQAYKRDDLESLCYSLIFLYKGELPWSKLNCEDYKDKYDFHREIKKYKEENLNWLYDIPGEFITLLLYSRQLKYTDEPNYKYICNLFNNLHNRTSCII